MEKSIFEFSNYKLYLKEKLDYLGKKERGYKQVTAEFIGCQASYLSQILTGKPDLTLEQAYRLNTRLLHDKMESKFFLLLVESARAGSIELKKYFTEQMGEVLASRHDLKKRLKETDQISQENMDRYYSSWLYTALHMALALPDMQEPSALAQRFNIPVEMAAGIVEFLEGSGLVEKVNGQYVFTKMRIHLDRNSNFIQRHHINWRSQSLQSVEKNFKEDMHYSTLFAIQKKDFDLIKDLFLKAINSASEIILPSNPEEVYAITVDLFRVG